MKAINTIHRILLGAAFTGGGVLAVLAVDSAAHAAEKPPAVQQPGGLLDLPTQTSDRAREVVEQATEPEPTDTPQPPRDEPTPAEPAPTTPAPAPAIPTPTLPNPGDVVDKVEDVVDQVPLPPMPELPPADPVDKTDRDDDGEPVITLPLPLAPATEPVQVEALTPIAPVPATQLPLDGAPLELYPHGVRALEAAVCEDEPQPEPDYERGHVRRILDRITGLHRAKPSRPLKPCPGHDIPPNATNGAVPAVKPPAGFGADLVAAGRSGLHHPTPALLRHCWPRAHLPASRVTCVEPGPA